MLGLLYSAQEIWGELTIFFVGIVLISVLAFALNHIMANRIGRMVERKPGLQTNYRFARSLIILIVVVLGVAMTTFAAFPSIGAAIASLFVAAGFASIVIGLAAQSTLSNLFAGMTISISQPIRIEEAVLFRDEFCFVEDIKLMYTVLRTWDNRRLMVPNSMLQNEVVVNYTRGDPTKLCPVFVSIAHDSDLEKALKIMVDVARRHPDCLPTGNLPNAVVMELNDAGARLRLLSRAKDQPTNFRMARELLREIRKEFWKNGIETAYPRRRVIFEPRAGRPPEGMVDSPD